MNRFSVKEIKERLESLSLDFTPVIVRKIQMLTDDSEANYSLSEAVKKVYSEPFLEEEPDFLFHEDTHTPKIGDKELQSQEYLYEGKEDLDN